MAHPDPAVADALRHVASRLHAFRERRGLTLSEVSTQTGISTSTLSRLETGQRRPSLDLLLPLASAYRVPLDDLVGAPESGDPRIRLRPRRSNGRTVIPLSHRTGDAHAWKIIVPPDHDAPSMRTHRGTAWIYVLSGMLRLIVGEEEFRMGAGEVAEFDTLIPHWFGSDGSQEAEILTIFGADGTPSPAKAAALATCIDAHRD